jgi:hypothetical protein
MCSQVPKFIPSLETERICSDVPKEVCHKERAKPELKKRNINKVWCGKSE